MTPIFEFTTSSVDYILAYIGNVVGSAMPIIVIVLGIGIGLWVLSYFIHK
jgi:type IV secretory pathway TrbL component